MISFGRPEYIAELKTMWQKIFGDTKRYLDSFFDKIYEAENTLVYLEDNIVVSALYIIPYNMFLDGKQKKIAYLYALVTDPAFRGRKIMATLIEKSFEICKERGYELSVLIPADKTLFEYYRKFGYEECFEQVKITKTLEEIKNELENMEVTTQEIGHTPIEFVKADSDQIWSVYHNNKIFETEGIVLSEEQNQFYINELENEGGEAFFFEFEGMDKKINQGYALLQLLNDEIVVYETNVNAVSLKEFYKSLVNKYEFKKVTFYQPICFDEAEMNLNKKPFAMAKKLNDTSKNKTLIDPFINRVLM